MFAHTFLVHNGRDGPSLRVVAPDEVTLRKKRPHRKSRLGCIRCKRRKVKCDETYPCRNCLNRGETCVRATPPSSTRGDDESPPPTALPREMDWSPLPEPDGGVPVNLLHMELLHHFERLTIPTLIFQEIWPTMLQLAFRSQQHTFLLNAMLSLAAAHLAYLVPHDIRYQRAKQIHLGRALHDYREALSAPITADNCDPLFGGAVLVHYLLWCDLSFMDGQGPLAASDHPLDLSGDRLYWLSTGQRQIFFMAWPLFQRPGSIFMRVGILQPCMALSDEVDARGLNWRRYAREFENIYKNPRFHGDRSGQPSLYPADTSSTSSFQTPPSPPLSEPSVCPMTAMFNPPEDPVPGGYYGFERPTDSSLRVSTLFEGYREGEMFVRSGGVANEMLTWAAYKRLAERVAIAMAFVADARRNGSSSTLGFQKDPVMGWYTSTFRQEDMVRYVLTFPMLCFGPLLPLISSGDSRMLVLLYHIYQVVEALLPTDQFWWCRQRVAVMKEAMREELRIRGLEVCMRDHSAAV